MGDITRNFSFSEFEKSQSATNLGIDNSIPDDTVRTNIRTLTEQVLQPARDKLTVVFRGTPVKLVITSGYRCPELNEAIGGSRTSFHCFGYAADLELRVKIKESWVEKNALLFHMLWAQGIYTELIWEYGVIDPLPYKTHPSWVHAAYNSNDQRQMLKYIS